MKEIKKIIAITGIRSEYDYLYPVLKEIQNFHSLFSKNPIFGIECTLEEKEKSLSERTVPAIVETVEIVDGETGASDAYAAYFAEGSKERDREPTFHNQMGLAVEKLRDGITLEMLWKVQ